MTPQDAVAFMAFVGGGYLVTRPLVNAIARRIARDPAPPGIADGALEDLRAEADEARARIAALEERVDFAERMLARQRESGRLAPPAGS